MKSFDLVFLFSGLNRPLKNHVRSGPSVEPCLEYLSLVYPGLGQINFFYLGSFLSWGLSGLTAFGANHKNLIINFLCCRPGSSPGQGCLFGVASKKIDEILFQSPRARKSDKNHRLGLKKITLELIFLQNRKFIRQKWVILERTRISRHF